MDGELASSIDTIRQEKNEGYISLIVVLEKDSPGL